MSDRLLLLTDNPNSVWDWANALSERVHAVEEIKAERRRIRRNELAARRRQIAKLQPQKRVETIAAVHEYDWHENTCCTCHLGHPPCSYCTNPENSEEHEDDE